MKKAAWVLLCFFVVLNGFISIAQTNLTLAEAKEIADTYYGSFRQMAKHPVGEIQIQNEGRLLDVIGNDNNGNPIASVFRVPNDLVTMRDHSRANKETLLITNYIGSFLQIAEEKGMDFSYKILSNDYQRGPEMRKSDATPPFVRVVVQKTIKTTDSPTALINDTMFLSTNNKSICLVTNQYGRLGFHYDDMTVSQMLAEADNLYSNKHYVEAYRWFQKVLEKDPRCTGASFSLGVMTFKGEGCKHYPKKVRDYLVDFYWQKSEEGRAELSLFQHTPNVINTAFSGYEVDPFPSNRLLAYNWDKKKYGYLSAQGDMVIKQQYQFAYPFFTNGTAIVKTDNKEWFLIDTTGKVREVFESVTQIGHKQFIVCRDGKRGVMNRVTGLLDIPMAYQVFIAYGEEPNSYATKKEDGKYGVLSANNVSLIPFTHECLDIVGRDACWIKVLCDYDKTKYHQLKKKYGYHPSRLPEDELKSVGVVLRFSNPFNAKGAALVQLDEKKWHLVDSTGMELGEYGFGMALPSTPYAELRQGDKVGFYNVKTGEWPVPLASRDAALIVSYGTKTIKVVFIDDEAAYENLKKQYDIIPDEMLKTIGELYVLPK